MPAATANAPNLTGYFKLDGSRNITGPTNIYNGTAASAVLTLRGAASQTGDLLRLQSNAPADLVKWLSDGRQETAFTLTGDASGHYGRFDTLTVDGTIGQAAGGYKLLASVPSGKALSTWYGQDIVTTITGRVDYGYSLNNTLTSTSAAAQSELYTNYSTLSHTGAGLLGYLVGSYFLTSASGPVTNHNGLWVETATNGTTGTGYGAQININNNGTTSTATRGLSVLANNAGTTPVLIGVDITVSGTAATKYALRTTGAGASVDGNSTVAGQLVTHNAGIPSFGGNGSIFASGTDTSGSKGVLMGVNIPYVSGAFGGHAIGYSNQANPKWLIGISRAITDENALCYFENSSAFAVRLSILSGGNIGMNTSEPVESLDINGNTVRIRTARTPASASAAGTQGSIAWDSNFIYVCVSASSWKRVAISSW